MSLMFLAFLGGVGHSALAIIAVASSALVSYPLLVQIKS
jgi:hypothetical protein